MTNKIRCLSREGLKIIALVLMLLDHMFMTVVSNNTMAWMTWVGRIAFPLFAFQLVEGFIHTSNRKKYISTIAIFAVISEIPYNLMMSGSWFDPFEQSVMVTFLLSLLMLMLLERILKSKMNVVLKAVVCVPTCILGFVVGTLLGVDYLGGGVLTVMLLYLAKQLKKPIWQFIGQAVALYFVNFNLMGGQVLILSNGWEIYIQGFAMFSLIFILLYNGKQQLEGTPAKVFKYFAYWFYPLHILTLTLLSINGIVF